MNARGKIFAASETNGIDFSVGRMCRIIVSTDCDCLSVTILRLHADLMKPTVAFVSSFTFVDRENLSMLCGEPYLCLAGIETQPE